MNFAVLWQFLKVFSVKFGGVASFGAAEMSNPRKFAPRNFFALESFPLYGVLRQC